MKPPDARARIIEASIHTIVRHGVSGASMSAIALEGAVSKALLHYHFEDRVELIAEVTSTIGRRLAARQRAVLQHAEPVRSVDALWNGFVSEIERGELYALLELGMVRDEVIHRAVANADHARRAATVATVGQLFARLGIAARVPEAMIADASTTFADGLVLSTATMSDRRVSFDVFWLAMLSLGD